MAFEQLDILRAFAAHLKPGVRVLDASQDRTAWQLLKALGFLALPVDEKADLRLVALPREHYDGLWAHQSLFRYKADECRRAMASFFYTLKPGGILFVSFEAGVLGDAETYAEDDYASLIRQHGFRLLKTGKDPADPIRIAFVASRI
jgi:hypothetical protein